MTMKQDIASGAKRVEETEHMQASLETPGDVAIGNNNIVGHVDAQHLTAGQSDTVLGTVTLGMFQMGNTVHVRVGSPTNSSELYEGVYDSAEDANVALIDAGILQRNMITDVVQLAGTGIKLNGLTSQQLEGAGLKHKVNATL